MSLIVKFGSQLRPPYANEEDDYPEGVFEDAWEDPFAEAAAEEAAAAVAEVEAFKRKEELIELICQRMTVIAAAKACRIAAAEAESAGDDELFMSAVIAHLAEERNIDDEGKVEKELAAYRKEYHTIMQEYPMLRESARGGN